MVHTEHSLSVGFYYFFLKVLFKPGFFSLSYLSLDLEHSCLCFEFYKEHNIESFSFLNGLTTSLPWNPFLAILSGRSCLSQSMSLLITMDAPWVLRLYACVQQVPKTVTLKNETLIILLLLSLFSLNLLGIGQVFVLNFFM